METHASSSAFDRRPLGRSGLSVLPLGLGTNKWAKADQAAILATFQHASTAGPCLIDTAEVYFSERAVGRCFGAAPGQAMVATNSRRCHFGPRRGA
jgi:aryl-alcohol dehydrogenase-like predicted oxidoreductase